MSSSGPCGKSRRAPTTGRFRIAGPVWRFILTRLGFVAIVTPWRTVYMLQEWFHDPATRAHEAHHLHQIDRDGAWWFWPKIIFDFVWHGYDASPYEIECREIETAVRNGKPD